MTTTPDRLRQPRTEAGPRCTCTPPDGVGRHHGDDCALFKVDAAYRQGREDEAASPVPAPTQTGFAWLIERGQPEKQVPTVWWKDRKRWGLTHMDDWTEDANEAARFATRDEAEAFIGSKFTPPVGEPSARAVEHGFLSPVPAPTLDAAYRERNALVAGLIRVGGFRAEIVMAPDTEGWWIVYVETPAGQLSWHVSPDDMDLFSDWPVAFGTHRSPWDGHTTDEKYRRLARLAADQEGSTE